MNIQYHPSYLKGQILYISIHNSGGLASNYYASTQHLKFDEINRAHKERWDFISSLGYFVGYNFVIEADGKVTQARAIGEEGAHTKGHNFDSIGIMLSGNFTKGVDSPTFLQINALKALIRQLPAAKIVPHRYLQSGTECFGNSLPDSWANDLLLPDIAELELKLSLLQKLLMLLTQLNSLRNKFGMFGSQGESCFDSDNRF